VKYTPFKPRVSKINNNIYIYLIITEVKLWNIWDSINAPPADVLHLIRTSQNIMRQPAIASHLAHSHLCHLTMHQLLRLHIFDSMSREDRRGSCCDYESTGLCVKDQRKTTKPLTKRHPVKFRTGYSREPEQADIAGMQQRDVICSASTVCSDVGLLEARQDQFIARSSSAFRL